MEYVFRIHDINPANPVPGATPPKAAANIQNWAASDKIQGNLLKNIMIGNPKKMGTSIPTIFARVFLFRGAFETMTGSVNDQYTKLASECLDMLEFLFQHGQSNKLTIRHWNAGTQINALSQSGNPAHIKLARILNDATHQYPELKDIYLFFWRDNSSAAGAPVEHLIGGTSPYTLVFTSPNWKRNMNEAGWTFNRLTGDKMFDGSVRLLQNRADDFKNMLYGVYNAYSDALLNDKASIFRVFLDKAWHLELVKSPIVVAMASNRPAFLAEYTPLTDVQGTQVSTPGVPVVYKRITLGNSDYTIECTSTRYKDYKDNAGTEHHVDDVLVLNEGGIAGARYVSGTQWNIATCRINEANIRNLRLDERILPGEMGIKHPFVTTCDFLEDKIVKLPYVIDNEHFVTAFNGNSHYLLPVRPFLFDFFNIEDLNKVVSVVGGKEYKLLTVETSQTGSTETVVVTLRIPVAHHMAGAALNSVIELKRKYSGNNIVRAGQAQLNLGVFPFYKVSDIPTEAEAARHNKYVVALAARDNAALAFKQIDAQRTLAPSPVKRSDTTANTLSTFYYDVDESFDIITIKTGGATGLAIPKFRTISNADVIGQMDVAVDFGTSNTYIAVKKGQSNPEPFTIDSANAQVVFLKKAGTQAQDNFIEITDNYILQREFVPAILGVNGASSSFPTRTATCEVNNFAAVPAKLFGTVSIGFNYLNETILGGNINYKYVTDLKWAFEKNLAAQDYQDRIRNYYTGLLWLIKNKCLIEGYGLPHTIYATFPQAMIAPVKAALLSCWQDAFKAMNLPFADVVAGGTVKHYFVSDNESVAPYHAMATTVLGSSYMNVDIGGGTSDILYIVKEDGQIKRSLFTSTKFAAEDLWGDGTNIMEAGAAGRKDNGFVAYLDTIIGATPELFGDAFQKYGMFKGLAQNSAEIMGFLFKYDDVFKISGKIAGQTNLYSLLFIHYAAVLYNIARILKKENINIPEILTFTGMGSKYTNIIISNDNDLTSLTKIFLERFSGKRAPDNFAVRRVPNSKEVTANGALIGPALTQAFRVSAETLSLVNDYGFDTEKEIKYKDVKEVKDAVIREYQKFIDILKTDNSIKQHLFAKYHLQIAGSLLEDLKRKATSSYNNVSGTVMAEFGDIPVAETLFFWPLKHALYEVSKNYQNYK